MASKCQKTDFAYRIMIDLNDLQNVVSLKKYATFYITYLFQCFVLIKTLQGTSVYKWEVINDFDIFSSNMYLMQRSQFYHRFPNAKIIQLYD